MFGVSRPLDIALRLAPYAAIIGLVIALLIAINQRDTARADHKILLAEISRKVAEAKAQDEAHARATEQLQQKVTNDVSKDYQARLADARARADSLRAYALKGAGRKPDLPAASGSPAGVDGAARCDRFPFDSVEDAVNKLIAAQDNTNKLLSLQDWERQQQALSEEHR